MTDTISLRGVRAFGRHGVYERERAEGQEFVIDLDLRLSLEPARRSDDVSDTVHYGELAERITEIVSGEPVDLIETLAGRIADEVLADPRIDSVAITVHKPSAPIPVPFGDVSVRLERSHEHTAVLALGGNLGDRRSHLDSAITAIAALPSVSVTAVSPRVESVAVTELGADASKPAYLNQVLLIRTGRDASDLLEALQGIEQARGRVRAERWGDRTLDIDIVSFDQREESVPGLDLPHPRAAERAFVLVPWSLVDPDAELPGHGRVADLAASLRHEVTVVQR